MCALHVSKSYRVKDFSSSFHKTRSFAILDHWSPASLFSWSAYLVRCCPTFLLPSLGSHIVSLCPIKIYKYNISNLTSRQYSETRCVKIYIKSTHKPNTEEVVNKTCTTTRVVKTTARNKNKTFFV